MALPLCLAVAIGVVPPLWISAAGAAEAAESEAGADESPAPTIYKWIDEHGIAHYTTDYDRIPRELRNRAGRLGPPDAAMRRKRVEPDAPATQTSPSPAADDAERWAVRDSPVDRPGDAWDEGDPYGAIAAPLVGEEEAVPGEEDGFVSESEMEERRQRLEDIDARIASLETDIAASEEALAALIAIPVAEGGGPLAMADDPTFREVADRLPKLLDDLRALEDERAQLEAP